MHSRAGGIYCSCMAFHSFFKMKSHFIKSILYILILLIIYVQCIVQYILILSKNRWLILDLYFCLQNFILFFTQEILSSDLSLYGALCKRCTTCGKKFYTGALVFNRVCDTTEIAPDVVFFHTVETFNVQFCANEEKNNSNFYLQTQCWTLVTYIN